MVEKRVKGELHWVKCSPERFDEYEGKKTWSATIYPDKDSLETIREMQGEGIKNKLSKDPEKGWKTKFSCPFNKVNKEGKITKVFQPPYMVDRTGTTIEGSLNNGAIGELVLDFYEHPVKGGATSHAARLAGIVLDTYSIYGADQKINTEVKQQSYF